MPTTASRLAAELDRLASADRSSLERRWRQVFGRPAPAALSPALLARALAYRVQAIALGDLDRETASILKQLGDRGDERGDGDRGDRPIAVPPPDGRRRTPGTLISREWGGRMHAVMVLDEGFAWNGATYASLSKVAHAITGTKWNGPRFFGLRETARSKVRAARTRAAAMPAEAS